MSRSRHEDRPARADRTPGQAGPARPVAPCRPLDLADLEREPWRGILRELDALREREDVSYLHASKRWEYPWALQQAGLQRPARVLDAGCGASIFPVYLARQGHAVAAVDLTVPGELRALHEVAIDYARGNLVGLPFADGAFDVVFCISVLEHLPVAGMPAALAEMRRVLAPGGRLLLTTDYFHTAGAEIWYEGPGERFRVDWSVFDRERLERVVLRAPGWRLLGPLDLGVDWGEVSPRMRRFHGYPYTSIGLALQRA